MQIYKQEDSVVAFLTCLLECLRKGIKYLELRINLQIRFSVKGNLVSDSVLTLCKK